MPDIGDVQLPVPPGSAAPDGPGAFLALLQKYSSQLDPKPTIGDLPAAVNNWLGRELVVESTPGARWQWNGTGWVMTGVAQFATQAARLAVLTAGVVQQGMRAYIADRGWTEQYFAAYNAVTNPGGARVAGWYPVDGAKLGGRVAGSVGGKTLTTGAYVIMPVANFSETTESAQKPNGLESFITGTTPGAWKAPIDGRYRLTAKTQFTTVADGAIISLSRNKATPISNNMDVTVGTALAAKSGFSLVDVAVDETTALAAGDLIRFNYLVLSAATLVGNPYELSFGIEFVEPVRG